MKSSPKTSQTEVAGDCRTQGGAALVGDLRMLMFFVSVLASVFGVLGALLLAMPTLPGYGFGAFLVSNIAWLIASAHQRQWPLHMQQWVFLLCSLIGLWNWWLGPLLLG